MVCVSVGSDAALGKRPISGWMWLGDGVAEGVWRQVGQPFSGGRPLSRLERSSKQAMAEAGTTHAYTSEACHKSCVTL